MTIPIFTPDQLGGFNTTELLLYNLLQCCAAANAPTRGGNDTPAVMPYSLIRSNTLGIEGAEIISQAPGQILGLNIINPNSITVYVKFYDDSNVDVESTTPQETIAVPAGGVFLIEPKAVPFSFFANAIAVAAHKDVLGMNEPIHPLLMEVKYK
jgi:hypothetical protein